MPEKVAEKMEVDDKDTPTTTSTDTPAEESKDVDAIALENLKETCRQLEKGESHLVVRALQTLAKTRKTLKVEILRKLVSSQLASAPVQRDALLKYLGAEAEPQQMDVDSHKPAGKSPRPARKGAPQLPSVVPEVEVFVHLLVVIFLMDQRRNQEVEESVQSLLHRIEQHDKRALDPVAAKAYFSLALVLERMGRFDDIKSYLNSRLRTATLRREYDSQAVLINCLLRSYLLSKQYSAAAKLVTKVTFPENANNNEWARYLYYQGRIKAMQLDYTAAARYLLQAMRKAPQDSAIGFKQNVQKWTVVISLLQGEIPERSTFRMPIYRKTLAPYLELTQAVRLGDLVKFNVALNKYGPTAFHADETITLIVRLRQNVIKTAVRQISTAYSRISVDDIRKKLQLQHGDEAEYIVAKAIKDGAIEAAMSFDKNGRSMQSSEPADIYSTTEPQYQFDNRIKYCLELHNQAVKALRYPPKSYAKDVESIEEQREREQQELEFAKEMADEDDDDF
uniref:PCI domain-containing protein n=1 Tax=Plectus sambesii TaxID=2011161 RepID=A0A914W423_9BILA